MTTMSPLEATAFELFTEVHKNLGHRFSFAQDADDYFHRPEVKAMWTEVTKLIEDPVESDDDCIEDYAYTLFVHVHRRLGDLPEASLTEEAFGWLSAREIAFGWLSAREMAWREIARAISRRMSDPGVEDPI